jgi:hypothetical protein
MINFHFLFTEAGAGAATFKNDTPSELSFLNLAPKIPVFSSVCYANKKKCK